MVPEASAAGTAAVMAECERKSAAQREALAIDPLATRETFDRHPAKELLTAAPADLDVTSNRYAREFRTRLRQELAEHGVNFRPFYFVWEDGHLVRLGPDGIDLPPNQFWDQYPSR